tara:strand:+ start:2871 stop:3101 length:231 start_codon:yes stop_codon:yes gene_type:complete
VKEYLRGVGDQAPQEKVVYQYWIVVLHLLQLGIAWNAIEDLTEQQLHLILGIDSAMKEQQAEQQARELAMNATLRR